MRKSTENEMIIMIIVILTPIIIMIMIIMILYFSAWFVSTYFAYLIKIFVNTIFNLFYSTDLLWKQ